MITHEAALLIKDPALISRWFMRVEGTDGPYSCIAESADVSFAKNPAKGRHFQGTQRFYPDFRDIDGISIAFYETYDFQVSKFINKWRGQIYRSDGSFGVPIEYKRKITAYMFALNKNAPILAFEMTGCWPTDRNPLNLTYDDDVGRVQVTTMFSVDKSDMVQDVQL